VATVLVLDDHGRSLALSAKHDHCHPLSLNMVHLGGVLWDRETLPLPQLLFSKMLTTLLTTTRGGKTLKGPSVVTALVAPWLWTHSQPSFLIIVHLGRVLWREGHSPTTTTFLFEGPTAALMAMF
jgi:hypothetical protein